MAARPYASPARSGAPYFPVFLIGLLILLAGTALLLMSISQREFRLPGAVCLLLGVIMTGSYLTSRLFSGMYADPLAYEPPWAKLGRGEGPPRLPAPGKLAAPASTPVTMEKLIDFPPAARPRRMVAPDRPPAPIPAPSNPETWTPELFDHMSPQQFDAVCEMLFSQSGLETRVQSHGAGGGVTLWLYSRHAKLDRDSPVSVAVCRLWPGQPLAVRQIHPLLAMMTARQLKRATYATASTFTDNARKFAKYNGINALDRTGLLALIATRTAAQQQALLALARGKR